MSNDNPIKRWTAKRKASVVMDIFRSKIKVAEIARQHDLTVSKVEDWTGEAHLQIYTLKSRVLSLLAPLLRLNA